MYSKSGVELYGPCINLHMQWLYGCDYPEKQSTYTLLLLY